MNSQKQPGIPVGQRHLLNTGKLKVQGIIHIRSEGCLSLAEVIGEFKEILWNTSIFWELILFISEDADGFKHLTIYMAVLYQCHPKLSSKQKVLQSNHG